MKTYGEIDEDVLKQMDMCRPNGELSALMGDNHLGYSMPIGGVIAYKDIVSVSGVGADIACGNCAVLLDIKADDIKKDMNSIMDTVFSTFAFGNGKVNPTPVEDDALFEDDSWKIPVCRSLKQKARTQLGTIGGGNHYIDIFEDEGGFVWVGVHFGSRGFGFNIHKHFMEVTNTKEGTFEPPLLLDVHSALGEEYIASMRLAGKYAYAGREWVCRTVAGILGARITDKVHNHHNFAWEEEHYGEKLWVVRKGATPAFPNQRGFIGGSMAENAVIIKGIDSEESKTSLYSTVHGAGRSMGRRQAKGKFKWQTVVEGEPKQCVRISEGLVKEEDMIDMVSKAGVVLRGGGVDESPHCYKRLSEVLELHSKTIEIMHVLKPLGVAMAGD